MIHTAYTTTILDNMVMHAYNSSNPPILVEYFHQYFYSVNYYYPVVFLHSNADEEREFSITYRMRMYTYKSSLAIHKL